MKNKLSTILILTLYLFNVCFTRANSAVSGYFSEKEFNSFFPQRNKFYSYASFAKAISEISFIKIKIEKRGDWIYKITRTDKRNNKETVIRQNKDWNETWAKAKPYSISTVDYADFCASKNINVNKKELAALFAHIAHETRNGINNKYNDGLMLNHELDTNANYTVANVTYPAVAGKKYYGRGPIQLSYNSNYGFASDCIFGNKNILLKNPGLLNTNPVTAFETAIYFWMTPQGAKPSPHDVITGKWKPSTAESQKGYKPGFGMTINIVNGALECNKGNDVAAMKDRIGFYQYFLKKFNVTDANCYCDCAKMVPYPG
ncbi:chitinase [Pedobacter sp. 22226]|uniref:chitinase n=1 Tax=Pedobacter sp. 22226 TaxID=3453894 RepID=UPI003F84195C